MTKLLTVGAMLGAQARLQPGRTGARDLDRALTFREWNARACRLAQTLLGLGLKKGDRVAVLAYNRLEWAEIYAAVAKAGLIVVPINFRLTAAEALFICTDSGASALIAEEALAGTADELRAILCLPAARFVMMGAGRPGWAEYERLISTAREDEPDMPVTPDDPWCLMYTSGTTGNSKGAIRSHRGMAMLALMTEVELSVRRRDDALLVMPMCHANSLNFFTSFLYIGACVTIFSRQNFDAALCLRTIGALGITFTSLVPTHYAMMLDVPPARRGTAGFERLAKLMISSAPARVETKRAVMEMFPNSGLYELYRPSTADRPGWQDPPAGDFRSAARGSGARLYRRGRWRRSSEFRPCRARGANISGCGRLRMPWRGRALCDCRGAGLSRPAGDFGEW